ncbi:MAG: hypothetical protein HYS13_03860 [Planctomycetia bacterium]|nr:hypothetical protein [Planctomycetia bacterium]
MTRVIVDANLPSVLPSLTETVELCDPSGRVLGQFIPKFDISQWEFDSPEPTEEELDRRAASNERTYTTAEVLAHLEAL